MTLIISMTAAVFLIAVSVIAIGFETNIRLLATKPHSVPLPGIIIYAIVLHYIWALSLLINPEVGHTTTLSDLYRVFDSTLPYILIGVATSSLFYLLLFNENKLWPVLCAMPQQTIMTFSSMTAVNAMIEGTFADGIPRSHLFIVADQAPSVIATVLHTIAIVLVFWRGSKEK